ncbi:class I SAM-dependent methyltransferase [Nakamurella flavida]|uniref:Class I SAM-dependent methyltransferase n=1 Tax=Nakamurella flavida TaxID=363630 RepID=A0A938YIH1_9ACTN|nr:class I SAM-dependent methyltransferase [Nakamurella flavida]MBM9475353.1 class I SAM-dependent methyltransferase [Nakamurella flavida]MDP9776931.1 SAM-dependent methyltransferase [Nakamurella flavida]
MTDRVGHRPTDRWGLVRAAYDTVAGSYADLVRIDEAEADLDLAMLAGFVARTAGRGPVLDAGCGPGRVTRHLADRGVRAFGVDLSPEMVRIARGLHPDLAFAAASIDALPVASGSAAGVLAWYSVIHTPPVDLPVVVGELLRVLAPGGWLLVAGQSGTGSRHIARGYGHDLDLTAYLHTADELARVIAAHGGTVRVRMTRGAERTERHEQAFVLAQRD